MTILGVTLADWVTFIEIGIHIGRDILGAVGL
jgi:hypothetical protein